VWTFGASVPGVTTQDFGKDAQYGTPDLSYYGHADQPGAAQSRVLRGVPSCQYLTN
jgi:hypothetical protein